ncbi:MAG: PQQ-binding-like beta-propeller repeat protein [Sedimentisphaerales bacterium]|jgi:outer membrane protein assembly factor BamB
MQRMFRDTIILLVGALVLSIAQNSLAAQGGPRGLISPELLKHAKLKVLWENDLPMRDGETIRQLVVLGNRVYAVSDHDYIISLDRQNGKIVFGETFRPAGPLVGGFKLYRDELLYVSGSRLIQIDAETGTERSSTELGFGVSCPAARNEAFFYIAGVDRRLHALRAEDMVQKFEVSADNDSLITSVLADDSFVVFATTAGNVICIKANEPVRLWQFNAFDAIAGPVERDFASLFFASRDTDVYRVDMVGLPEHTRLVWKYQAAAELDRSPRVTQEFVYQPVHDKGVTAINKETGIRLWSVPGGVDLLAEHRSRAYVMTEAGTLTVMDNARGKKLYTVNFAPVSRFAVNTTDDKMYVADTQGRMACLQPLE